MSVQRLFGTDGVRGRRGTTRSTIPPWRGSARRSCARCSRRYSRRTAGRGRAERRPLRFVVGRDTRESGEWIEEELARGAGSEGASVTSAGVIPTPAIAYVTPAMAFDAGIVISASHNPFEDNGIKVFSGKGEKFTEALEREVEAIVARTRLVGPGTARARVDQTNVIDEYIAHTRPALFPIRAALRGATHRDRLGERGDDDRGAERSSRSLDSS